MERWKYGQCIKTGLRHLQTGADCQDHVFHAEDERCIVAALCDGLGSLPYSGEAAKYTAVAACRILQRCAGYDFRPLIAERGGLLREVLEGVNAALETRLAELEIDRSQADSTLAFVFISKTYRFCYAACLGDSAVCLIGSKGMLCLTESNACSESTASLDMDSPWLYAAQELVALDDGDFLGAILTSDGLDGEIYTKDSTQVFQSAAHYFNAILAEDFEAAVSARIDALQADCGDYYDDDCSVAVISRAEAPLEFPADPTWLCRCGARNALTDTYCTQCDADFMDVYSRVSFKKYGGKLQFFRYVNRRPQLEIEAAGVIRRQPDD